MFFVKFWFDFLSVQLFFSSFFTLPVVHVLECLMERNVPIGNGARCAPFANGVDPTLF